MSLLGSTWSQLLNLSLGSLLDITENRYLHSFGHFRIQNSQAGMQVQVLTSDLEFSVEIHLQQATQPGKFS